mgnify:CR=1 FL=1
MVRMAAASSGASMCWQYMGETYDMRRYQAPYVARGSVSPTRSNTDSVTWCGAGGGKAWVMARY